ncbi:uncharacterized protein BCR38DRAFT_489425 [Pseudomassariella vexata]|uniref:Uncharacterized protein n=1 Tax=Pseudomassariella vexata TaxID=1141098 RepID=A0A1Y2DGZ5_9PEZI|nr:uncharacterized protein BCR38DRAFT_489425 [Pseudomassariella vexata]ORY58507.1 hypothetical protein BCR38DRAFT_489425 [Pseudomassariella vexata]
METERIAQDAVQNWPYQYSAVPQRPDRPPQPPMTSNILSKLNYTTKPLKFGEIAIPIHFNTSDAHNTLFMILDPDQPPSTREFVARIADLIPKLGLERFLPHFQTAEEQLCEMIRMENVQFVWSFGDDHGRSRRAGGPRVGTTVLAQLDDEGLRVCLQAFIARGERDHVYVDVAFSSVVL